MSSRSFTKTMIKPVEVLIEDGDWVRIEVAGDDSIPGPYITEGSVYCRTKEEWADLGVHGPTGFYVGPTKVDHEDVKLLDHRPQF